MTYRIKQLFIWLLLGLNSFSTIAAPDDDPLTKLIQERQLPDEEIDQEGLDELLRQKSQEFNNMQQRPASTQSNQAIPQNPYSARPNPTVPNAAPVASNPSHARSNNRNDADELIASAMGFLGVAYRFGGTSPTGFDCSGFMQYIFRKTFAVNLPRTSAEQATVGVFVNRNELQPGDMVFFRTSGNRISHVGMYVGNDRFIHAPRTGKNIEITSLSHKYWNSRYATARRVKRNNAQNFIRH